MKERRQNVLGSRPSTPTCSTGFLWPLLIALCCSVLLPICSNAKTPIYVTASFVGKNDLFLENLTPEEVVILEDGHPRNIAFMARDELPVAYGLIFDQEMLSESPEDESYTRSGAHRLSAAAAAKNMAYELIDKYLGTQTVWIGSYGAQLGVVLDSTSDRFRAKESIQQLRGTKTAQESSLYSALFSGVRKMSARTEKRRVLLVFLDTVDVQTSAKLKPLKNLLASSNSELFLLSFAAGSSAIAAGRLPPPMSRGALTEMAQMTAGEAFFVSPYDNHPDDTIRTLINHLRTLYTFGFEAESTDGSASRLVIRTTRPESKVKTHPNLPARQ